MAIRTIKHKDHEHSYRVTHEEVLGLKFDDRESEKISDTFGVSGELFFKAMDSFQAFIAFQEAAEKLDEGLPESTLISNFADFLKSDAFKRLGMKVSSPNDYLVLGLIFSSVLMNDRLQGVSEKLDSLSAKIPKSLSLEGDVAKDFLELLKKLKK